MLHGLSFAQQKRLLLLVLFYASFFFAVSGIQLETQIYLLSILWLTTCNISIKWFYTGFIELFHPLNFVLLNCFYIYFVGYFTYSLRTNLGLAVYSHSHSSVNQGLAVVVLSLLSLLSIYKIVIRLKIRVFRYNVYYSIGSLERFKWYILFLLLVAVVILFWSLIGNVPLLISDYHSVARKELGKGLGGIEMLMNSLINLFLLYFILNFNKNKKVVKENIVIFLLILFLFILNGDRGIMISYMLSVWFLYYYYCSRPRLKYFVSIFLFFIFFAGLIGFGRNKGDNILLLGAEVATEMGVEFDNYIETFKMVENGDYLYGSTLIPIITLPVPRAILSNKDDFLTAGNYFKEYHNHEHIRVGERMSYIGELNMNWGIFGSIIGMGVLGALIAFVTKKFQNTNSVGMYFLCIYTFGVFGLILGDIPTIFISIIMGNILFFIFYFLSNILILNKNNDLHRS